MHRINDDGTTIRIEGKGFYDEAETRAHFDTLARLIANRRRAGRQVKALVDLREAATQAAGTAQLIAGETNRIYCAPSDRVAIVVSSLLLKLQLKRVHRQQGFHITLTLAEAERFLASQADAVDA